MTKLSKRRNSSVEHRSTKRRKQSSDSSPVYSTRIITWAEQLTLPPRFREERDVWPALRILRERSIGRKKEYLLEWEKHPITNEKFKPNWVVAENVGQELKKEWKREGSSHKQKADAKEALLIHSSGSASQTDAVNQQNINRRINNRRIIPDSSAEVEGSEEVNNSVSSRTPTLTGSPGSAESVPSPIEISETQPQERPAPVRVIVPPAPVDKSDWESLHDSQFSHYQTPSNFTSPFSTNLQTDNSNPVTYQHSPLAQQSVTLESLSTSSAAPSPRSGRLTTRNRINHIKRILDYQPTHQDLLSTEEQSGIPTTPIQQSNPGFHQEYSKSQEHRDSQSRSTSAAKSNENLSLASNWEVRKTHLDLSPIQTRSASKQGTQPWTFQSQVLLESGTPPYRYSKPDFKNPSLSGRCARKTTSNPASQGSETSVIKSGCTPSSKALSQQSGMAARPSTRQSPRLSTVVPHTDAGSPRIAVRTNSFRSRSVLNPPEHSSPLAASAEFAESPQNSVAAGVGNSSIMNSYSTEPETSNILDMPSVSIAPSAMHIHPAETSVLGSLSQGSVESDSELHTLPLIVQESIEEEVTSSAEEASLASKASSSQESLRNERPVPQVDGLVMPTYPILGDDEYAIPLPAEGKVQAIYSQTIKVKRKAILKFIRRRGSVNHASTSSNKTIERNEMIELIGRLHDTTTHIDLGLPGIPTQYTIPSQQHAAYAEYAGSKFVFLGYLMDFFRRRSETIVIMAKSGATQDLLEEYLYMKNVQVRRRDRTYGSQQPPEQILAGPRVELLTTKSSEIVRLDEPPSLIIAFDASFESLDPQVKSLRAQSTNSIPIIHLLVTNSSEHVEKCLPASMPSPIRLRLLVRATYQACLNLGGSPTIFANIADELDGRPMDLGDISRAVRKSPNRRLEMMATVVANAALSDDFATNYTLSGLPELVLDELDDSPSSDSTVSAATGGRSRNRSQTPVSRTAGSSRNRSQTPTSRATTPSARKRQLEVDTAGAVNKRQRMTPLIEQADVRENEHISTRDQELHRMIDALRVDLANEKRAREAAEQARDAAQKKAAEWQTSLASLQRRYEKRTKKFHMQQKSDRALGIQIEATKARVERVTTDNVNLRQQLQQKTLDLEAARNDLKSAGGDIAMLELTRNEARVATTKAVALEKSLENTKRDFEFLRNQYQDASNRAAELGAQVTGLEGQVALLSNKASDEKRRLKALNQAEDVKQHLAKIAQLEAEKRSIQVMYKKLEEESKLLKRNRGVQTRGSSTAPGTPGQRSRQGSPAANAGPPSGSRASVLRHER